MIPTMILTTEDLENLLVAVLERVTGLGPGRVLLGGGNAGPRSTDDLYCSLWWRGIEPLRQNHGAYRGIHGPSNPDNPDNPDQSGLITQILDNPAWCDMRVRFQGPGAMRTAVATAGWLQNDDRWFDLWRLVGFGGVNAVMDDGAPFGGHMQSRASFDLSFYAGFGAEYPVAWFDVSQWTVAQYPSGGPHLEEFEASGGQRG